MPVEWKFAERSIVLGGVSEETIDPEDGARQRATACAILDALRTQPGIVLADEVGMGKTYVALGVVASVLLAEHPSSGPVVVMVPRGLAEKWPQEWAQFKAVCCRRRAELDRVQTAFARDATAFFKLLDDPIDGRPRLIWATTSCFSRGLKDPWVKLGLIRLARSATRMNEPKRKRLCKWAASLVRLEHHRQFDRALIERLLESDLTRWRQMLVDAEVLDQKADDPIPAQLVRYAAGLDFSALVEVLHEALPGHRGAVSRKREREARKKFDEAYKDIYREWVRRVPWRAPLLVLDEAHHAKNDTTRLARLLRSEDAEQLIVSGGTAARRPLLWDKFDRMLFLTATPFQLGHQELIRVLKSFGGARWTGDRAPARSQQEFFKKIDVLNTRLDDNRLAGRHLDKLWGGLDWTQVYDGVGRPDITHVDSWWEGVTGGCQDSLEGELQRSVDQCRRTKQIAEQDPQDPWASIRTWVIRHNRPIRLTSRQDLFVPRRQPRPGRAVSVSQPADAQALPDGLPVPADAALPFLLAARAQGELAAGTSKARAYFAEGLCSSYEAFHHTREQRGDARDVDDEGAERRISRQQATRPASIVPVSWYESQIELFVPSKETDPERRLAHPKLSAVVERAVSLWRAGEKVLIFCFYRQTARALRDHLRKKVEDATFAMAAEKLGIPNHSRAVRERLESIARRFSDTDSPFYDAMRDRLSGAFDEPNLAILESRRTDLLDRLFAYIRTPAFIARYLPLDDPMVRRALAEGEKRTSVTRAGAKAMAAAIDSQKDASGLTFRRKVQEFLEFARELGKRAEVRAVGDEEEDGTDPLTEYLDAVAYVSRRIDDDEDETTRAPGQRQRRAYRVLSPVRMVFGDTDWDVRGRLMLAFNSPLFPEILISSAVLGEGVDLHRFCRYVIHHDLCWNPSTLEQRTGRLDRIRCKAEWVGQPIEVFEPFLSGSADERMFRVVRDRERWFQIVMGQEFKFDERTSEELASRVPLPTRLARELVFDLARYRPQSDLAGESGLGGT